jgi:hypothetical protein
MTDEIFLLIMDEKFERSDTIRHEEGRNPLTCTPEFIF